MPRNITSLQLSPKGIKIPITKVRLSSGRLEQNLPANWTQQSKPSDGTKRNHKQEFVTVSLLDGFRAEFSNITSFSVLKVTSSVLGTLVITPGGRTEMMVGEGV